MWLTAEESRGQSNSTARKETFHPLNDIGMCKIFILCLCNPATGKSPMQIAELHKCTLDAAHCVDLRQWWSAGYSCVAPGNLRWKQVNMRFSPQKASLSFTAIQLGSSHVAPPCSTLVPGAHSSVSSFKPLTWGFFFFFFFSRQYGLSHTTPPIDIFYTISKSQINVFCLREQTIELHNNLFVWHQEPVVHTAPSLLEILVVSKYEV